MKELPKPEGIEFDYMLMQRLFSVQSHYRMDTSTFSTMAWIKKLKTHIVGDIRDVVSTLYWLDEDAIQDP